MAGHLQVPIRYQLGNWYMTGTLLQPTTRESEWGSDIKPVNWLNIMPSITYFNHGPEIQRLELPRRAMGVDVNLVLPDSTWSLSTAVQYSNYQQSGMRELTYNNKDKDKDLTALDMSFKFRQQVNDRLDFTVVGQHIQKSSTRPEDYLDNYKADQRLSLQLNSCIKNKVLRFVRDWQLLPIPFFIIKLLQHHTVGITPMPPSAGAKMNVSWIDPWRGGR